MQVIREAHRVSPSAPDYTAADYFMGWRYKKQAHGVDSGLPSHVATELKMRLRSLRRLERPKKSNRLAAETQARLGEAVRLSRALVPSWSLQSWPWADFQRLHGPEWATILMLEAGPFFFLETSDGENFFLCPQLLSPIRIQVTLSPAGGERPG